MKKKLPYGAILVHEVSAFRRGGSSPIAHADISIPFHEHFKEWRVRTTSIGGSETKTVFSEEQAWEILGQFINELNHRYPDLYYIEREG